MASATPDLRLPAQPPDIAALWTSGRFVKTGTMGTLASQAETGV